MSEQVIRNLFLKNKKQTVTAHTDAVLFLCQLAKRSRRAHAGITEMPYFITAAQRKITKKQQNYPQNSWECEISPPQKALKKRKEKKHAVILDQQELEQKSSSRDAEDAQPAKRTHSSRNQGNCGFSLGSLCLIVTRQRCRHVVRWRLRKS